MRAARLHDYHADLGSGDVLSVDDILEPSIVRDDEVIVRVGAAGLCRTDLHLIEGVWRGRISPSLPHTPGHENVGWVEAVGKGVSAFRAGDAVVLHPLLTDGLCRACRRGDDMRCSAAVFPGLDIDGGFAELMVTRERNLVACPEGLDPVQVAPHADAGLTAYHAVKRALPRLPPGSVAVLIGLGGLGHVALQLLKTLTGAQCIVIEKRQSAIELARELGADTALLASGSTAEEMSDLTDGLGADVVFDFVGEGGTPDLGLAITAAGGQYFVIGYGGTVKVPTIDLVSQEKSIIGNQVGTFAELRELMQLVGSDRIHLNIRTYRLSEVNQAVRDLAAGEIDGRAVLIP